MQQIVTDVGKDVGDFIKDFSLNYICQLVNTQIQDITNSAIDKVVPSAFQTNDDDDGGDDGVEEKKDEEKDPGVPIAAGAALIGHRMEYGPDRAYHRYYDFAVWSIKPSDSVISKAVRRHKPILDWVSAIKKSIPNAPEQEFPKKKLFGKNPDYYTSRFTTMRTYFRVMTPVQAVSTSEYFLKFWNLQYDATRAANREIFFAALQKTCEKSNIDWNTAKWRAEIIGLDLDEVEMLKIVAVEKVGGAATQKIRDQVYSLGYVPGPVKGKFITSAEAKVAGIISSTVENGWRAAQESFNKVVDTLREALDKASEPLKQLIDKALEPVSKIVKEKFDKLDKSLDADDGLDRTVTTSRFPPLAAALQSLGQGKASEAVAKLIQSVNTMEQANLYVGYLRYNLGDPEIGQYIPFLNEIQENHYRLTISLTDVAYVLSRAGVNAFEPLLKYLDKVVDNGYDEKSHEKEIQDAVREGGRRLAIDFFSLPQTVSRACWYCGRTTEKTVLKVGETTTWALADLLGSTATNWKPTSKEDARAKFIEALTGPLDNFISDRVKTFVSAVRKSTCNIIARQLSSVVGDPINTIADTLNDLTKNLPPPIGDNLKPGDFVKYMLEKFANNLVTIGVKLLAKKTEAIMYSQDGVAQPLDRWEVERYRWAPRIRNYDDDNVEPEGDKKAATADADANASSDANAKSDDTKGDANTTTATTSTDANTTTSS